jgi:RHS repeat-associated protein
MILNRPPWEAYTYDANDNAGRTHPVESAAYQHCWDTPTSILIDALGRTMRSVERNREPGTGPGSPVEETITQSIYDIRGNVLTIIDALKREAFKYVYDYANRKLRLESIDAGLRQTVLDALSSVVEQRDSKGALTLHGYDSLNRPIRLWARDRKDQRLTLREQAVYGDGGSPNQPAVDRTSNQAANRLGKPFKYYDEAGLLTFDNYDFKGNLLEKKRRVVSDATILGVFNPPPSGWQVEAFRVDWDNLAATPLDGQEYTSTITYDALNRIKVMTYPEDVEHQRRKLIPHYNRAGALESVLLERAGAGGGSAGNTFVESIAYNAKGQRVLIAYGNGIMTRYAYDPHTFRLTHLRTEKFEKPNEFTYRHMKQPLQEFGYDYDLVGNFLGINDQTPGSGIDGSVAGIDKLDREFVYDALYRLRSATGRECDRTLNMPWNESSRCTDLTKTRGYTEQYLYDITGNIQQLKHLSNGAGFSRDFDLVASNNRLNKMSVGVTDFNYQYDTNGNMVEEATSRHFEWDWADRMKVFRTQTGASEPSVFAHYLYDSGGQRVKKLVRKGNQVEVTVYIDGIFEYQRIVQGGTIEQNNTLHVMDNQSRIALVRVGNAFVHDTTPAVKYHLGDHLGSSNMVIDDLGNWINREEYTPYGETSYGSFLHKRYRFTGKERDEESGLNYHGARYYASWLGKWLSCDPAGIIDGINLYVYVKNSPISIIDPTGREGEGEVIQESAENYGVTEGTQVFGKIDTNVKINVGDTYLQSWEQETQSSYSNRQINFEADNIKVDALPPRIPGKNGYSYSYSFAKAPELSDEEILQREELLAKLDMQSRFFEVMSASQAYEDFKARAVVEMTTFLGTELLTAGVGGLWMMGGRRLSLGSKTAKNVAEASFTAKEGEHFVEFYHGGSASHVNDMAKNGIKPVSVHTHKYPAGSFFTTEASQQNALQAAFDWASRGTSAADARVLKISVPKNIVDDLVKKGLLRTGQPPGLPFFPQESVFLPKALDTLNKNATFDIIRPPLN